MIWFQLRFEKKPDLKLELLIGIVGFEFAFNLSSKKGYPATH